MPKPIYRVVSYSISVHDTPEEHYWAEKIRAELDDHGEWRPDGPSAEHRRALDRALLLGPDRG